MILLPLLSLFRGKDLGDFLVGGPADSLHLSPRFALSQRGIVPHRLQMLLLTLEEGEDFSLLFVSDVLRPDPASYVLKP